ncbi:hypothetical protein IA539_12365 [Gordonia sp. zg691]|uniref:hypothetical protein n=1 Tax=Gordonia jinghuaiqii TaxID=2758710 RepID=UPI001662850E|nr:hypothetical protein [Gordonia jinghuaiqii]MBD0862001.1 hypothetical protein [Gordonia jinghuaiqii]
MTDTGVRQIAMDTEQVYGVAAYYRRSALVVTAVADDLTAHEFGTWARAHRAPADAGAGPDAATLARLAATYSEMSATLAQRLRAQARAAGVLADSLRNSAISMSAGDEQVAGEISRGLPASGVNPR